MVFLDWFRVVCVVFVYSSRLSRVFVGFVRGKSRLPTSVSTSKSSCSGGAQMGDVLWPAVHLFCSATTTWNGQCHPSMTLAEGKNLQENHVQRKRIIAYFVVLLFNRALDCIITCRFTQVNGSGSASCVTRAIWRRESTTSTWNLTKNSCFQRPRKSDSMHHKILNSFVCAQRYWTPGKRKRWWTLVHSQCWRATCLLAWNTRPHCGFVLCPTVFYSRK